METFSASQALCEGNPPVTGGFPHKGQWPSTVMFSLPEQTVGKQWRRRWFQVPSCSIWHQYYELHLTVFRDVWLLIHALDTLFCHQSPVSSIWLILYSILFWWCLVVTQIWINSLAPGKSWCDFKNVIFNLALLIGIFKSSYDNVLRWMPQDLTDDKSTLVQVMAWCRQATSHYLNQCWPRSPTSYGVTRPQWVNTGSGNGIAWQHQAITWTNVDL